MKGFLQVTIFAFLLGGCAEANLGYGFGSGSGSADSNKPITIKEQQVKLYTFNSPLNPSGDWREQYVNFEMFKKEFNNEAYFISQNWVELSSRFFKTPRKIRYADPTGKRHIPDAHLSGYLNALAGKVSLEKAHTAYFSAFYPNSTVLSQEQRSVKGIKCMQTKAMYEGKSLVELQCPVFFRNTFGTITYMLAMNTTGIWDNGLKFEDLITQYGNEKGMEIYDRLHPISRQMRDAGVKDASSYIDYYMPAFEHIVETTEFIEPPSQKIPEGFSLDEQFKRIQEPNWKL